MARARIIGVVGGPALPDSLECRLAEAVGRAVAKAGFVLLCGGRGGVMEAAAKGAFEAGGLTLGILPGAKACPQHNDYVRVAVYTNLNDARNYVNASSADVLVAVGGSYGTLSEIALGLKVKTPVILLTPWEFLKQAYPHEEHLVYLDHRQFTSPDDCARAVLEQVNRWTAGAC